MDNTLDQLQALCVQLGIPVPPPPLVPEPVLSPAPRDPPANIVYTSVYGTNAELMERIAALYFKPGYRIADVTYGRGAFWRSIDTRNYDFHPSDLKTCPAAPFDFRHLPYQDGTFDVVAFDPPYAHGRGRHYFDANYRNSELENVSGHAEIMQLYEGGMAECARILNPCGLLLVKCQDEIESGRQQRSHIEIYEMARRSGMVDQDLFVLTRRHAPSWRQQQHARKNHSFMWVFKKLPNRRDRKPAFIESPADITTMVVGEFNDLRGEKMMDMTEILEKFERAKKKWRSGGYHRLRFHAPRPLYYVFREGGVKTYLKVHRDYYLYLGSTTENIYSLPGYGEEVLVTEDRRRAWQASIKRLSVHCKQQEEYLRADIAELERKKAELETMREDVR